MKEITISPRVKIVIDEDCDNCLHWENKAREYQQIIGTLDFIVSMMENWHFKEVKNLWDNGYNQCVMDLQKKIANLKKSGSY